MKSFGKNIKVEVLYQWFLLTKHKNITTNSFNVPVSKQSFRFQKPIFKGGPLRGLFLH